MVKPHIRISEFGNVPMWEIVWPYPYSRTSPSGLSLREFVRSKNRERMPTGFGPAWRAANPRVCDCMMPVPVSLACSQELGPHRRPTLPLRGGVDW